MCGGEYVCVCVRERGCKRVVERDYVCVRETERERDRERV